MQLSRSLLGWHFHSVRSVTVVAATMAAIFALVNPGQLEGSVFVVLTFIALQCVLTAWLTGRYESPAACFLYTRGFTRDRLWSHRILAHLLCVLAVWGPASLIVWLGIRSAF